MRTLLIGYGSIGKRHEEVLQSLGHEVTIVSSQPMATYQTIDEIPCINHYSYIVICNETSLHEESYQTLKKMNYQGTVLIEKPIFSSYPNSLKLLPRTYTAYNLRYHPCIQFLKQELVTQEIFSVQAYVGQYLPTWRKGVSSKKTYSAYKEQGGGVLRDLSHELDYLTYLFGTWTELIAVQKRLADVTVDSEDHLGLMYTSAFVPFIQLQMNYLDHTIQRFCIINTSSDTYTLDFIQQTVKKNGKVILRVTENRNYTYEQQHRDVMQVCPAVAATAEEGVKIVAMIEAIEQSAQERRWIKNGKTLYDRC